MSDRVDVISERGLRHAWLVLLGTLPLGALGLLAAAAVAPPLGPVLLVVLTLLPASVSVGLVARGWEELCGSAGRATGYGAGLVGVALLAGLGLGAVLGVAGGGSTPAVLVGAAVGLTVPAGVLASLGTRVRRRLLA